MSLANDLSRTVETVRSAVPGPIFEAIGASIVDLKASGIAEQAAGQGDRVPLPILENLDGGLLALSEVANGGPVVLLFYRGGWCPYCNVALRAYASALPEIEAAGGRIVAITPELPEEAGRTAENGGVGFPIAVDRGNVFARTLGLVFSLPAELRPLYREIGIDLASHNGDDTHELPVPAVYVLDTAGTIRWAFVEADFTQRADPGDVVAALRRLQDEPAASARAG